MTPAARRKWLRKITDSLNPSGQTRLAEAMGRDASTIRKKLSGDLPISEDDVVLIGIALEKLKREKRE